MPAVRSLFAAVLLAAPSLFAETIAGPMSGEIPLTPATMQASGGIQINVAAGERGFLATWLDYRNPSYHLAPHGVFADRDGRPIQPGGMRLGCERTSFPFALRDGFGLMSYSWDGWRFHRFGPDGSESQPPRKLAGVGLAGSTGSTFAVFRSSGVGGSTGLVFYDASGEEIAEHDFVADPLWEVETRQSVASESGFVIHRGERFKGGCTSGCSRSVLQYFAPDGRQRATAYVSLNTTADERVTVGTSGALTLLLVVSTAKNPKEARAYLANEAGLVEGPLSFPQWWDWYPKIEWDGSAFVIADRERTSPYALWIRRIGVAPFAVREPQNLGVVPFFDIAAHDGRLFLVLYAEDAAIRGMFVPESGAPEESGLLSQSAPPQELLGVADGPAVDLALWREKGMSEHSQRIVATRIDRAGRPLDRGGLHVADELERSSPVHAAATPFGPNFLIAWTANAALHTRVLSDTGEFAGDSQTAAPAAPGHEDSVAIVRAGSHAIVFWNALVDDKPSLVAMRVRANGTPVDAQPVVVDAAGPAKSVAASFNGDDAVVAWSRLRTDCFHCTRADISAARVSPELLVRDVTPLDQTYTTPDHVLSVATVGATSLVLWPTGDRVRATRMRDGRALDLDGVTTPPELVANDPYAMSRASAAAATGSGSRFLVATSLETWERVEQALIALDPHRPLREQLAPEIILTTPLQLMACSSAAPPHGVALTTASAGSALLLYTREADELQYGGVRRLFLRTLGAPARGRSVRP
ncbi:MAG: hypothetical protein ACYC7A_01930 [Thermoanaerobaculia bacterium]